MSAPLPVDSSSTTDCSVTVAARLQADAAERVEGVKVRGVPRLHVGPAAAVEPVALDRGLERRPRPEVGGAGRHHVHMGLEDEGAPPLLPGPVDGDDDRGLGMLVRDGRAAGMATDRLRVHREAVHGVAALAPGPEDVVLDGVLLAAERGEADEVLGEGDLVGEAVLDGSGDALGERVVEGHETASAADEAPVRLAPGIAASNWRV